MANKNETGAAGTAKAGGPAKKEKETADKKSVKLTGTHVIVGNGRGYLGRNQEKTVTAEVAEKLINSGFATLKTDK